MSEKTSNRVDPALEPLTVGFHWQGGWRFWRREDGSVVIFNEDAPTISAIGPIPPDEWASIVHATLREAIDAARTAATTE